MNSANSFPEIEEHTFGYVQRRIYKQPDLYHEEVVELDSPFATIDANGTQVFTFLLLGDQNAGKSTFLHSFTFQDDPEFLEITSFLPILTSTFVNTRFYFGDKNSKVFKPIDELPFIDTDLARLTLLITRDDFIFFLNEFEIQTNEQIFQFGDDIRYIVIQFIEIGGDHLDSIMQEHISFPLLKENNEIEIEHKDKKEIRNILSKSLQLLLNSQKTIYFINANSLFSYQFLHLPNNKHILSLKLLKAPFLVLLSRLRFLNSIFQNRNDTVHQSQRILFYVSRLFDIPSLVLKEYHSSLSSSQNNQQCYLFDAFLDLDSFTSIINEETGISMQFQNFPNSNENSTTIISQEIQLTNKSDIEIQLKQVLMEVLSTIKQKEQWNNIDIVDLSMAKHLSTCQEGEMTTTTLNAKEIIKTVARCFKKEMVHSVSSPQYLVLHHLFNCFKKHATIHSSSSNYAILWISRDLFQEYLESLEEGSQYIQMNVSEVPESTLLNQYDNVSKILSSIPLVIPSFYAEEQVDHSNISATFKMNDKILYWSPQLALSSVRSYLGIETTATPSTKIQKTEESILFMSHTRNKKEKKKEERIESIRFPHQRKLVEVIESIIARNIPFMGEFLMQSNWRENTSEIFESIRTNLTGVIPNLKLAFEELITAIRSKLQNILEIGKQIKSLQKLDISTEQQINTFFWLLEDFSLASTLLSKLSQNPFNSVVNVLMKKEDIKLLPFIGFSETFPVNNLSVLLLGSE